MSNITTELKSRWGKVGIAAVMALTAFVPAVAEHLVILHTNDTHSQIEPDRHNRGGVMRRKVAIDSIRLAEPHTMLIDLGDFVQGTLYFHLYGGRVEQQIMNDLGYDIRILGNHEFDIGSDSIATILSNSKAELLSTNYDLRGCRLGELFRPYSVHEVADRRIGFMAINLDPEGMIAPGRYDGVNYLDGIEAANAMAWYLRNVEHCDMVVALTHIGYDTEGADLTDIALVQNTRGIDLVLGGHSHDVVTPGVENMPAYAMNLDGVKVPIAQAGKAGLNLGKVDIDLETLEISQSMLPIDARYDRRTAGTVAEYLESYKTGVEALYTIPVLKTKQEMPSSSDLMRNFLSDFIYDRGAELTENVDLAIMNNGGIRTDMPKGTVSKGLLLEMLPFGNALMVVDVKGSDLIEIFDIMAQGRVTAISRQVAVEYQPAIKTPDTERPGKIIDVTIMGQPIDPDRTYRVATIDYLANGGDYLAPFKNAKHVVTSNKPLVNLIIDYYTVGAGRGKKVNPQPKPRFKPITH